VVLGPALQAQAVGNSPQSEWFGSSGALAGKKAINVNIVKSVVSISKQEKHLPETMTSRRVTEKLDGGKTGRHGAIINFPLRTTKVKSPRMTWSLGPNSIFAHPVFIAAIISVVCLLIAYSPEIIRVLYDVLG
jgi:hypothetical protein